MGCTVRARGQEDAQEPGQEDAQEPGQNDWPLNSLPLFLTAQNVLL